MKSKEIEETNKTSKEINIDSNKELNESLNEEENTKSKEIMITTVDNPYNPFDDFASWYMFDVEKNYFTCSKLARIMKIKDGMSEVEVDNEIIRSINRLIEIDPLDIYIKVTQ